ncbi:nitrate- and nitrite sensing domain-containing protein [Actinoplanes sp. NPDC051851]|uniref:sensor histidine kinase n=1 Tax=Actinoplanes sp. NPDC051851 TaxID=3154753 RepID=UPI003415AF15
MLAPTSADLTSPPPGAPASPAPASEVAERSGKRQQSIRRRVVRLVLVPSVVALAVWLAASAYLIYQGFYNRTVAVSVREVSIPAVSALSSIQQERRLSVAYLARPSRDLTTLLDQRRQTDEQLTELRAVADSALAQAPASITTRWDTLTGYLDQLATTRSAIDARSTSAAQAYAFYNELLDTATELFDTQARGVPDATATQGGLTSTEVFRASDMMTRAASTMDGAFAAGSLTRTQYLEFVQLVDSYHYQLDQASTHLEPGPAEQLEAIEASSAWKDLVAAENSIIAAGPWKKGVPSALTVSSVNRDRWTSLTGTVSSNLVDLTVLEADKVSARTLRTGNNQLLTALVGSLVALLVAIIAILWALRQSSVLVDRALSIRLSRLGQEADDLVDQRLPAIMERLRKREQVDLATEFASKDYGSDEIGQVSRVINRSLRAAAEAAVDEAKARAAGTAMLMGVARRPQRPLQRGLKTVEDLQAQMGDEKVMERLFDIHHQLNQTRRFLENLVILAGGQIGRRFQKPVPLRRVLLASFSETHNYQRINLRGGADVSLVGHAVAEVVHLMAELLDNALAFSPPGTTVWVTPSRVNHGVAIEIEDAGVGMGQEAVERANTLLATAPTPEVTELKDGSQVGLYVVAELAKREGLQVSLRRSAYGGLLAIVLLPDRVLVAGGGEPEPADAEPTPPAGLAAVPPPEEPRRDRNWQTATGIAPVVNRSSVGVLEPEATNGRVPAQRQPQQPPSQPGPLQQAPSQPVQPVQPQQAVQPPIAPRGRQTLGGLTGHTAPIPVTPPVIPPAAPPAGGPPAASPAAASNGGGKRPLPQRRPQQHLAPGLREEAVVEDDTAQVTASRSPEEARNRFARYQRGWADGRAADSDDNEPTAEQGRNA